MAKRRVTNEPLDEMFEDGMAAEAAQQGKPPKKYGNVTDEQDPFIPLAVQQAERPEEPPAEAPVESEAPAEEPESEAPAPEQPETVTAAPDYASRIEALERELLFARAAQAPVQPPAPPTPAAQEPPVLPFNITPQDIDMFRNADPALAAQMFQGALQAIYQRARQDGFSDSISAYTGVQSQAAKTATLRAQFQGQYPELADPRYSDIVNAAGTQVAAMYPDVANRSPHLLLGEVAKVAHERLAGLGVQVKRPAAPAAKARTQKTRPAALEGTGASRQGGPGGPRRRMTDQERILTEMFDDAMGGVRH